MPYATAFRSHGDAEAFAHAYIPTLRSWTESTFFSALDPSRSEDERRAIIDSYYGAYQADVAANPEGHGMDYVHCFMAIEERRSEGERFELIMEVVDQYTLILPTRASDASLREGRACPYQPT